MLCAMSIHTLSYTAIFFYLLASARLAYPLLRPLAQQGPAKLPVMLLSLLALFFHGLVLYQSILVPDGLNLGFYHALSMMGWVVALLVVLIGLARPIENLSLIFMPATAVCVLLAMFFPHQRLLTDSANIGLQIHILFSITAYGLLAMAAVQALVLAVQEYLLHNKHPVKVMRVLPPLQLMEDSLLQLLAIGFFLLSLSLATGLMFVHDILAQHLAHKITLSIMAWIIFGLVLLGRWARGWRGQTLIRLTLGGFGLLVLSYFGSKFVLELILKRV